MLPTKHWYLCSKWIYPTRCLRACKHCVRCSKLCGVQLYKNNAHALILSIVNLDWLQHARSTHGVYEYPFNNLTCHLLLTRIHCILPGFSPDYDPTAPVLESAASDPNLVPIQSRPDRVPEVCVAWAPVRICKIVLHCVVYAAHPGHYCSLHAGCGDWWPSHSLMRKRERERERKDLSKLFLMLAPLLVKGKVKTEAQGSWP